MGMLLSYFVGDNKSPKEILKYLDLEMCLSLESIDKEILNLKNKEYAMINEIKKEALINSKNNLKDSLKEVHINRQLMSKLTNVKINMLKMRGNLRVISTNNEIYTFMKNNVKLMKIMNKTISNTGIIKTINSFEKELSLLDFKQETMNESMDEVFSKDESEEIDEDKFMEEIYSEILLKSSINPIENKEDVEIKERIHKIKND